MKVGNCQKGMALYLTMVLLSLLLALALGISAISLGQIKTLTEAGNSVASFYAAETGIERSLFEGGGLGSHYADTLANGASYSADVISPGPDCPGSNLCVKSVGTFKGTQRALQIAR